MTKPRVHQQDGVAILDFEGASINLDESALTGLQDGVLEASNVEPPLLVVDLSHVDFFGSSFIELLFRLWSRMNGRHGKFAICGLSPYCKEVIDVTNLNTLWTICDTQAEAIAHVKAA